MVLVTGGAGAIGVNLVNKLLDENVSKIVVVDNFSSGNINFLPKSEKVEVCSIDIFRFDELRTVCKEYESDFVFHLAAHFANQNSVDHPFSDIQTNVIGTMNLLELSRESKNLKKFVYASSSCVYGDSEIMREDDFIYPYETPYAINKYSAEMYVKYYAHNFKLPSISVRIFNTYGPYEVAGKYRNVIPKFIENAMLGKDIVITGGGNETRDFTYSSDTVELLLKAAISDVNNGDYFNGGTGKETKIVDLASMIIELTNSKSKIVFKPRREWDLVTKRVSDISKSKKVLGYNPVINLKDGLSKYINWYREYLNKV